MRAWGLVAFVLFALLAPTAGAQAVLQGETCRPPVLSFQPPPDTFEPGDSHTLLFAIENPNGPPVDVVRATVTTTAPAGWSATPAQRELTLGPRNVSVDVLAVTAPNRGSGQPAGNVTLVVTFVCASGDIQTSSSTQATLEVALSPFRAPWPLVVGSLVVLAMGVTALGVRRLRRGLAVTTLTVERTVEPGKSAKFTFVLENRRGKPQRHRIAIDGLPSGWSLHLALTEVDLEPGEEKTLWAILKAPPSAAEGERVDVRLRFDAPGARGETPVAHLRARVEAAG